MENQKKKRAVIYCRVSTKEQAEEGNSLVTQEKNCREYALKFGYEIAAVFIEQGESAKTADRTELKKLMSFCSSKKNGIYAVIAYKIDRISRNTDDYSQIRIYLKKYGVEIRSTTEFFEDNPAGRFMENIIANVAQFDNDVRAERSIGGMRDAVREGRYVWMAPLGYSNVRVAGKATIAPNHLAPAVKRIFEEVSLNLQPIEQVRKRIVKEGFVGTRGISKSNFYSIIKNELYAGWIKKFGERHKGAFEPIIDEEIFQKVQSVLSSKIQRHKTYQLKNPHFPLRKFFRHPSGKMFTGCWSKGRNKKYPYYLLHKININIRKEVLENFFKNYLNQFRIDIEIYEKLRGLVNQHLDKCLDDKKTEIERLKRMVAGLKEKQTILLEKNIEGIISNELCKERIDALDIEIRRINEFIHSLPETNINYTALFKLIRDILLNPGEVWEKIDFERKIKLQWFYFPHGIKFDGKESRTDEICNLFKLKGQISSCLSCIVPFSVSKSNTQNQQISPPCHKGINDELFWNQIGEEIIELKEIIFPPPHAQFSP